MPGRLNADDLLLNPGRGLMFDVLRQHGPMTLKALSTECGLSPSTAMWHLRKLQSAGIVEREPPGRGAQVRIVESNQTRVSHAKRVLVDPQVRDLVVQITKAPAALFVGDHQADVPAQLATDLQEAGLTELVDWDGRDALVPTKLAEQIVSMRRIPRNNR